MLSLGPLSKDRHCPYQCAFCYVDHGYGRYASLPVPEIVNAVRSSSAPYDIVYVSGDTDSFAPPRTDTGIELLDGLAGLGVDLLFTTRTTFETRHLAQLADIACRLARSGLLLFGCVSIPRLDSCSYLESANTPPTRARITTLRDLKERHLVTVLTLRPFLPVIPVAEYLEVVSMCRDFVDIVLGECWYADVHGILEQRVFRGPTPEDVRFVLREMDFDVNVNQWKVWEGAEVERAVRDHCAALGLPFFMRSRPAVEYARRLLGRP
jgi:hypothetical protein